MHQGQAEKALDNRQRLTRGKILNNQLFGNKIQQENNAGDAVKNKAV